MSRLEVIKLEFLLRLRIKRDDFCLRTRVGKQPIIALYSESETVRKFYNLEAWFVSSVSPTVFIHVY